jgi:DNA repair ATPase RecN
MPREAIPWAFFIILEKKLRKAKITITRFKETAVSCLGRSIIVFTHPNLFKMMTNQEKFQQLAQKYTPEELVDAYMVPEILPDEELQRANQTLKEIRLQKIANQTEEQRLLSDLLRFKFQVEDIVKKA